MIRGLLFSQIGYEQGDPVRVILRGPAGFGDQAFARAGEAVTQFSYWGTLWGEHWWVADFGQEIGPGKHPLIATGTPEPVPGGVIRVGQSLLWTKTFAHVAIGQLERRAKFGKDGYAWQDAGALWQETPSHAGMATGLLDVLEHMGPHLDDAERTQVTRWAKYAADYLAHLQRLAAEDGYDDGRIAHDQLTNRPHHLPADAFRMAWTCARAANLVPGVDAGEYRRRARRALDWAMANPTVHNLQPRPHGLAPGFEPPLEHRTADLLVALGARFELAKSGDAHDRDRAIGLAKEILSRQVKPEQAEDGIFGHFRTFSSASVTEKSWTHHLETNTFGTDCGQVYPHYVVPLIQMLRAWPEHPEAERWHSALHMFAYGFLLPACSRNPFNLLPLGFYGDEGWLHFAGSWHGMNAIYGWAAALALEFEALFTDPVFRGVATGNLQWVAGLNAGITREAVEIGCEMTTYDLPEGLALPASMILGAGERQAGSWMNIRGSIANGFSAGKQFRFDIEPTRANDAPSSFTDEDWITHGGGWLSGIARLEAARYHEGSR